MSEANPYHPPAVANGTGFLPAGRTVSAGRGWQWIADGWNLFVRQPALWIVDGLALLFVVTILPYTPPVLGGIASALLSPVILGGLMLGAAAVQQGQPLTFAHVFAGFQKNAGALLLLGFVWLVCLAIIMLAAAFTIGFGVIGTMAAAMANADPANALPSLIAVVMGSIMTIMLGTLVALALLVPVAMMFWFAPALIVMHDLGAGTALKASFIACLKNVVPFLLYGLAMLVLSMIAAIPFMLGLLILVPVTIASAYTGYRDIFFRV